MDELCFKLTYRASQRQPEWPPGMVRLCGAWDRTCLRKLTRFIYGNSRRVARSSECSLHRLRGRDVLILQSACLLAALYRCYRTTVPRGRV